MSNSSETSNVLSLDKKVLYSSVAAVVFFLVSLPQVYNQTSRLTTTISDMCPTPEGKFIHSAVYFLIVYILMKLSASQNYLNTGYQSDGVLLKHAFTGTLLFFLLTSSDTYRLTRKAYSGLASELGCPTVVGVGVHAIVFLVVLVLTMYFPKD